MPKKPNSLSIVMTYYNEEENIIPSLQGALDYCKPRFDDFEIVAVDDCSKDRTFELGSKIAQAEPAVRLIHLPENTKFAGALKRGFAEATKEYVFYTDGDCPIDYNDIDKSFEIADRYDVVVGVRTTRGAEGPLRKLYTMGYRLTLRILFGLRLRDVNFSYKLFPRLALQRIDVESKGSFIDAEIMYKMQSLGYKIGETPIDYISRVRGVSTLAKPSIILKILGEMIRFRLRSLAPGWSAAKPGK